jgi:Maintenance of mitochondrial structure and function
LETAVSERIAVERVLREQPPQKDTDVTSPFVVHTENLQQSVGAIQDRITVLEQFLELTASSAIPYDHALIRQVQGLLLHASVHSASNITITPDVSSDALLQQLAVLAKCVSAVQQYTDKARAVHESNTTVRSGRGLFSSFKK